MPSAAKRGRRERALGRGSGRWARETRMRGAGKRMLGRGRECACADGRMRGARTGVRLRRWTHAGRADGSACAPMDACGSKARATGTESQARERWAVRRIVRPARPVSRERMFHVKHSEARGTQWAPRLIRAMRGTRPARDEALNPRSTMRRARSARGETPDLRDARRSIHAKRGTCRGSRTPRSTAMTSGAFFSPTISLSSFAVFSGERMFHVKHSAPAAC